MSQDPMDGANGAAEDQAATAIAEAAREVGGRPAPPGGLSMLQGVRLTLSVELGRTRMKIADILNLSTGSVVELEKLASEPVDLLVNDTPFARGEVVVVDDHFSIKITELLDTPNLDLGGKA